MAANAITVIPSRHASARFGALRTASRQLCAGVAAWGSRLSTMGQLGPDRERELGRHTGARI